MGFPRAAVLFALGLAGCQFSFDRQLSPGQIRGLAVFSPSPGAALVPASGATVKIENTSISVVCDDRGSFIISGLPIGTYSIDITAQTGGVVTAGLRVANITLGTVQPAKLDGRDLGQLVIGALGGMAGMVTSNGLPAGGAVAALSGVGSKVTAAAGTYSFANLLPGDYTLALAYTQTTGVAHIVRPLSVHVNPRLVTTIPTVDLGQAPAVTQGSMSGAVSRSGSSTNSGATVALYGAPTSAQTDNTGTYTANNIPAGVYTLTASAPGDTSVAVPAVVIGGEVTQISLIVLTPGPATPPMMAPDGGTVPINPVLQQTEAFSLGPTFNSSSPNFQYVGSQAPPAAPETSPHFTLVPAITASGAP